MTTTIDERRGATSASNAAADALCQGRHQAQRGLPDFPGPDAEHGRVIHEALKNNDSSKLDLDQRETFDRCQSIEKNLVAQYFGNEKAKVFRETRFWVKVDAEGHEHSGMPDVVYKGGIKALVIEYKTLPGDVPDSPHNLQLRDQVVLVAGHLMAKEVAAAVIQPLVTMQPEVCLYDGPAIQRSTQEMFARVQASNAPNAPRAAGETQCKFCRAAKAGVCVQYQQFVATKAPSTELIVNTPVAMWSPEQRTFFCDHLAIIQKWLDDCKDAMKAALIVDPKGIPGWTLKDGAEKETITDPQTAADRFMAVGGTLQQFMGCITVGKTKLKQALADATKAKGKALDAQLKEITEGIVKVTVSEPSLKREKE